MGSESQVERSRHISDDVRVQTSEACEIVRRLEIQNETKKNRRIYVIKERRIVTQRTDRVIKNQEI